ncbi:MAG: hypothetical protein K2X26_04620 [Chitinophagaceae bacterium]|nr:hypothetical protein [Chitinophagaceae bacterium]
MKLNKLAKWVLSFFRKSEKWKLVRVTQSPERVNQRTIYVEYNEGVSWQILILCPCGCQTVLYLNTLEEYKPNWRLIFDKKGEVFIHPSINRQEGCCSHFFIKNSRVLWV